MPTEDELKIFWDLISYNSGHKVAHKLIRYMKERRTFRDRWVEALIHADMPRMLINGVDDPISGKHMVERYNELVSTKNVVLLEGTGHYPQLEATQRVLTEFFAFIQE